MLLQPGCNPSATVGCMLGETEKGVALPQLRDKPRVERPPLGRVERPSRFFRWMGWLLGLLFVLGVAGLVWYLASPAPVSTDIVMEDFTGVDDFVASRVAASVEPTPFQEDFSGVDTHVRSQVAGSATETPFQEDFTGVDDFVASRVAASVEPTPFQEDFSGLD